MCGAGTSLASEEVTLRVTAGTAGQELAWAHGARKEMKAGASRRGWFLPSWGQAPTLLFKQLPPG